MLKRIMFTLLALLVVYSAILVGYAIYEPDQTDEESLTAAHQDMIEYETLQEYTKSSGASSIHYYFFCRADSNDCLYVENTVLKSLSAEVGESTMNLIEYVDLSSLDLSQISARLKNEWNVSTYPAFVSCHNKNGKIIVDSVLEWNPSQPFSTTDLLNWLVKNGLYDGASVDQAIETPQS